jgi:O-antigen/teichoic acid export membrane protein
MTLGQVLRGEAKDALVFVGSNLLNRVGALVLLPLYWTRLSPEDFGILAVIAVIGAFQTLPSLASLDLAITRQYYEWPEGVRRRNLGAIWSWNWLASAASGGLFLLAIPVLGPVLFPDVPYDPWLYLGIVSNTLSNLFIIPASTIRIKRLPWLFFAFNVGGFLASATLGLWFVLVLDQGLRGLLVATILSNLLLAAVGAIAMLRFGRPCLTSPGLGDAFRFSLPAVPSQLISTTASILDRALLSWFTNLQTLGVYSVALRLVEALNALHASLKMTYGPFMMKNIAAHRERGIELVAKVTPYFLIPYFAGALGLSLFIGPVVRLVDQPQYFAVIGLVPWLAGIQIVSTLYFYYCNGLFLGNRTELLSIPAAVHLTLLAITSVLLIGPFQVAGVIISRYIAAAVFFSFSLYLSQKAFPIPHRWATLLQLGAATVLFASLGQVLMLDNAIWEIAIKAIAWAAFVGVAWLLVDAGSRVRQRPSLQNP